VGCVLVKIEADRIATKLVYVDDDSVVQVADEHLARALPVR
jgi:hypothetical protein